MCFAHAREGHVCNGVLWGCKKAGKLEAFWKKI